MRRTRDIVMFALTLASSSCIVHTHDHNSFDEIYYDCRDFAYEVYRECERDGGWKTRDCEMIFDVVDDACYRTAREEWCATTDVSCTHTLD